MFINNNLRIKIDEDHKILWVGIDLQDKLCYSINFLDNLSHVKELIIYMIKKEQIKYVVAYSLNKGVWNLGGDLEFFVSCIRNNNRSALKDYAYKCVDLVYNFNNNYDLDIFSTCVVQGNAFGGGFESALSGNYIIAEQSAKFSFPEVIFGTFPGMGAYSFLTKKVGFTRASEIINSNKTFSAKEIFDLGIINKVCDDGHGLAVVSSMIKNGELVGYMNNPFSTICNRVSRQELIDVVEVWLDRAFTLGEDNLARMMKLASFQRRKVDQNKELEPKIEEEQKLTTINSLINSSFQPTDNG
jgi:DSF synthase